MAFVKKNNILNNVYERVLYNDRFILELVSGLEL